MSTTLCLALVALCTQQVDPLTDDETRAMKTITEKKVVSTVSFLASDEMRGRNTPSPELDRACDYVAKRLRDAGLSPLGDDETFFHRSSWKAIAFPKAGDVTLKIAKGAPIKCLGVMLASDEAISAEGTPVDADGDFEKDGIVIMDEPPADNAYRAFSSLRSGARRLERRGAKVVLVRVAPNSGLLKLAKEFEITVPGRMGRRVPKVAIILVARKARVGKRLTIEVPPKLTKGIPVRNVIGILGGSDPQLKKEAILFTAHLDHIGVGAGTGDVINNGADDDASGVTAVLALADAFAALKERPARSTIFMTFWGEEKGLLGSKDFAARPTFPLDKIIANVNIEMVGRPEQGAEKKAWMTGWPESDLGSLMAKGATRAGVEIFEHPRFSAMLYRASDNFSFVRKGVIAHSFSAGSMHKDYHAPGDHWQKLEIPHMTRVIQGLFAGALPLARGKLTPKKK